MITHDVPRVWARPATPAATFYALGWTADRVAASNARAAFLEDSSVNDERPDDESGNELFGDGRPHVERAGVEISIQVNWRVYIWHWSMPRRYSLIWVGRLHSQLCTERTDGIVPERMRAVMTAQLLQ